MPCLVRFIISSWFLKLNYPLFSFSFLLFLFLIENGSHEIRGFCFCYFVFWAYQKKKFVLWVLQSNLQSNFVGDCLNLIMFLKWRPNEMRERERDEIWEGDGGLRWMVGTGLQALSCFCFSHFWFRCFNGVRHHAVSV